MSSVPRLLLQTLSKHVNDHHMRSDLHKISSIVYYRESSMSSNYGFPRLIINRRSAAEHRADPSGDPDGSNTVFSQIYEGLKPRNPNERTLDYRFVSDATADILLYVYVKISCLKDACDC